MRRPLLSAGLGALVIIFAVLPAAANFVCEVEPTRDGFVALRAGPSAQSALIARMRPGDGVILRMRRSGDWRSATYWPDGQIPNETDARFREGRQGWVHRRLVGCDI